ncbi:MAG: metal ABC transporter ATP-binding protein [Pseudomonadota bacterium]
MLRASGLDLGYRDAPVLRDVGFSLDAGDILAVVGHNGSGKTTLVKTLLGVLPALGGRFDWAAGARPKIAYLGQMTEFDRRFPIRVRDLAAMGAWRGLGWRGMIGPDRRALIDAALDQTGVAAIADHPIHEISSGQLQRALFARTIVQDAPLILLDEPFSAVDQTTEAALLSLLSGWREEGRAIVVVLHDLSAVLQYATSALLLGDGRARFGSPRATLTPEHLIDQRYLSGPQMRWLAQMLDGAAPADV